MIDIIVALVRIILYFAFVIFAYILTKHVKGKAWYFRKGRIYIVQGTQERLSLWAMLLLALLLGGYSMLCGSVPSATDRGNYADNFVNHRFERVSRDSIGLGILEKALNIITDNPYVLFLVVTALTLFIILIAYNMLDGCAEVILLMGLSQYCIYALYLLKQAPAMAFSLLSIAFFRKKRWLAGVIAIVVAIGFHESAFVMIPILMVLLLGDKKPFRVMVYVALLAGLLAFRQIMEIALIIVKRFLPSAMDQLAGYLDSNGTIRVSMNYGTVLKGFPYYWITLFGIVKHRTLERKIPYYNQYMLLSFAGSIATLMSVYFYWFFRLGAYCYFPMFIFASLLYRNMKNEAERKLLKYGVAGSFFLLTFRYLVMIYVSKGGF